MSDKSLRFESLIQSQEKSSKSIESFCRDNNVTSGQFHYWKQKQKLTSKLNNDQSKELISKSQNRMKILRMESGGLVVYAKMLDMGRFHRPEPNAEGIIEWRDLVVMVEGIIEQKDRRLRRLKMRARG